MATSQQSRILARRMARPLALTALGVLLLALASCTPAAPTPAPTATPLPPTATPLPPTATPTGTATALPLERPPATPAPVETVAVLASPAPGSLSVLYAMSDSGNTDWRSLNPAFGPVGSAVRVLWEQIHPAPGKFDWSRIDRYLETAASQRVRLRSGEETAKPLLLSVGIYSAWAPNWAYNHYDHAPQWVYQGLKQPTLGGRHVGYLLEPEGCTPTSAPLYDNEQYLQALRQMILALGQRYNNDPRLTGVLIANGIDDETRAIV
ncbi:MAG: hypothetical protein GX605_06140, partial [Chloroflexi bacterium]|nr:hypothetical protein [Chloroflexota bacterium]